MEDKKEVVTHNYLITSVGDRDNEIFKQVTTGAQKGLHLPSYYINEKKCIQDYIGL